MAVALITGASSGIGQLSALELARRGHRVFASMRNLESASYLQAKAEKEQLSVETVPLDVTDADSVRAAIAQVSERAGRLEVLINNAGFGSFGDSPELNAREDVMDNPTDYYKSNGPMTAAGAHRAELSALPSDLAKLCEVVQGVLIHRDMAPFLYNLNLSKEQRDDGNFRSVERMVTAIHALDSRPLTSAREPAKRLPGVCRHFSLLLSGMLQQHGIPARPRCGFGAYFNKGKFEDHWVCEYWNAAEKRWILVDAQLDAVQKRQFKPDFNTLDVPRDRFIIAGDAWQTCRAGRTEPKNFGLSMIPGLRGMWFIAGNVVRDLASLNGMAMLPWDVWGLMEMKDDALTEEKKKLLDRVATLTLAGDEAFPQIREIYESDNRLKVPPVVFNPDRNASEPIAIS